MNEIEEIERMLDEYKKEINFISSRMIGVRVVGGLDKSIDASGLDRKKFETLREFERLVREAEGVIEEFKALGNSDEVVFSLPEFQKPDIKLILESILKKIKEKRDQLLASDKTLKEEIERIYQYKRDLNWGKYQPVFRRSERR
ncbi:MAG: hypothetical protein DRO00_01100 [Thermoproteota archaeon]|nr:MAG: hypothetical protein DRO00_01100 [Candidatus Korarchaeota archaeon]